ncbi:MULTISPECIES: hypothetical protein [unclassified Vibrio]|uniref:hypothetical protein n=1 Tax=unclassified Vibrio TaxID=2614977 RepID=UPI0025578FC5|nr:MULTISPECIES: hypothetical protein [unclassified Vibrio]EJL6785702.1 hypothetical protein [Vibrio alginolyticus]MDK9785568.1 hypothetical protein [Vibrio sp. D421a]
MFNKIIFIFIFIFIFVLLPVSLSIVLNLDSNDDISVDSVLETLAESGAIIVDETSGLKELVPTALTAQDKCLLETSVNFFDLVEKKKTGVVFNQSELLLEYGWVALEVSARYIALNRAGLVNFCYATGLTENEGATRDCEQLNTDELLKHLDIGNTLSLDQANTIAIKTVHMLTNFKNSSFEKAFGSCVKM